jgi:hypothetical protein
MAALGQFETYFHMARRGLDLRGLSLHFQFRELRRAYYAEFWQNAATAASAECSPLTDGFLRIRRGAQSIIVRGPDLRLDDHLTLEIFGNKPLTYKLLAEQGCETVRHARFSLRDLAPALRLLGSLKGRLVVKPASGTGGGQGVVTGVGDPRALKKAAWQAAKFDSQLMAEEQIEGHSFRLLYLDGVLIDAVRRDPPRVTGDGKSSIRALANVETLRRLEQRPYSALSPLRIDLDAANRLARDGLTPNSVPPTGQTVIVKGAINENSASQNHRVLNIHASTVDLGTKLAKNLGVKLMGLDVIAQDIAQPLSRENGIVGEVNTTPGLHHHDLTAKPAKTNIAGRILRHMFMTKQGVITETPVASLERAG